MSKPDPKDKTVWRSVRGFHHADGSPLSRKEWNEYTLRSEDDRLEWVRWANRVMKKISGGKNPLEGSTIEGWRAVIESFIDGVLVR